MTNEEINALKREHDALHASGRELVAQLEDIADKVLALRDRIEEAEGNTDLQSEYEIRCASLVVVRRGMASWHESATFVSISDEGGGDFVEVSQTPSDRLKQIVAIDPDEWHMLRRAIDQMIAACAVTERK